MSEPAAEAASPAPTSTAGPLRRYWYLILLVALVCGAFAHWWRFYAFTDQYYAPEQPIAYSHKLHAGLYAIDCQYCHFNARQGKHAGIPPASVCLGCHGTEKGQVGAGKPGIEQLLSVMEKAGIEGYAATDLNHTQDIADGPTIQKEGGVVHWDRIHLLPDHVYFPHEWHVKAGVSCQTCHGPIQEMEVVYQFSDLTMGWCLDCHRNDNYVGGPQYVQGEMDTFRVGVGDYDVIRHRIRPDDVVAFQVESETAIAKLKGDGHHGDDHGDGLEGPDGQGDHNSAKPFSRDMRSVFAESLNDQGFGRPLAADSTPEDPKFQDWADRPASDQGTLAYFTDGQAAKLELLLKKYPDLPRWRIQDLPETHREFYGLDAQNELRHLQNAPTHCNTCHQ